MCIVDFKKYTERRDKTMCNDIVEKVHNKRRTEGYEYTFDDMQDITEDILKSIQYSGNKTVPIIDIAYKMGFKVFQKEMENNLSGFIIVGKLATKLFEYDKIIMTNVKDEYGHQRFVVAHELAHYLFDCDPDLKDTYYDTYWKNSHKTAKEKIANTFAANLLMPKKEFITNFDPQLGFEDAVRKSKDYFDVQEKAVRKRVFEVISDVI